MKVVNLTGFTVLSFVRISQLSWIGHFNRMGSKRSVSQVFNNNPLEVN